LLESATIRDFFLGRDFQNLGENRKFRYPPRNCSTGQKNSTNLNLNSNTVSNKERVRLLWYKSLWRGGDYADSYYFSHGPVIDFPCRMNFCSLFLIFAAKNHKGAGSVIRASDQRFVPRKLLPLGR
jgi:hypothetical protein